MSWAADLAREISGVVLTDERAQEAVASDFGRLVVRKPKAVVRPASAADVASVLKFAARQSLRVATRGSGHSQSGQSLSESIVLDMTSLNGIGAVREGAVTVQAGTTWRALVEHLAVERLSPPVLTNNLDVTVGGTVSMGGLGVSSWRHGTQVDNCLELEVVTGTGDIVRCSGDHNRELFDAVRAGVGQFGVITEAVARVRRYRPRFRSFYLLYDNLVALLEDLETVMTEERFDYLEAWCAPCPQGFRRAKGQRQAFAQWFYPLHATLEIDQDPAPEPGETLKGMKFYKHVHTEDGELLDFFTRLDPLFDLWKRGGYWQHAHPWMECILPWQTAAPYISRVLVDLPPQAMLGGHILLWPARGAVSLAPFFMRPKGDLLMGFGILPAMPKQVSGEGLPRLNLASQAALLMGGKRYLSGWVEFNASAWRAHYGDQWAAVVAAKGKFDPQGILNSGFIKYE